MITNFRDIGGIDTSVGKLKSGFFFRSGQLTDLTNSDEQFLKDGCKLKKIYDLRSHAEIEKQPDTKITGIQIENIDILASEEKNGASLAGIINSKNIKGTMLKTYTELITSESALKGYSKFLTEILQEKNPILFHCFAGKDRTGFAAALLLKLAGASEEQILTDYLKTNTERQTENKQIMGSMKEKLTPDQMNVLKVGLVVDESYIVHAKKILNKTFGTFENYLSTGLTLPPGYTEQFRKIYVESN